MKLLRLVVFPWFIWHVVTSIARDLLGSRLGSSRTARTLGVMLQTGAYVVVGLPVTIVLSGELAITLNEAVIAEQADYRLQTDPGAGADDLEYPTPGPKSFRPTRVVPGSNETYRRYLVELYAPVILQKISNHPQWDIPLSMTFDGNTDPRDNVANEPDHRPHVASVYGELTAETTDSYYLTYSLYHVKDYDHPVREMISRWTYHDNDNEGFHIRVDKRTMSVAEVETWFHNRFLLFNRTGISTGTEPVHGKFYVENGTHVVIYSQPQGHGVRCAQLVDRPSLEWNVKVLRYRGDRDTVPVRADRSVQNDATYELVSFDRWYEHARRTNDNAADDTGMFAESIVLGTNADGSKRTIGRFIAGRDYQIDGWSRPKPMWSWDDGWDDIPVFVWHFFPSVAFTSHGGTQLSHDYTYNRPCEKVFGESADGVFRSLSLPVVMREDGKWESLHGRGGGLGHGWYWAAAQKALKAYVNYVFHALG